MGSVWADLKKKAANWVHFEPYCLKLYLGLWDLILHYQTESATRLKAATFVRSDWLENPPKGYY